MITMFRGAVVSLIYSHTLSLQADAYDESASVTLMSTDVDIIAQSLQQVNEAWARLIEIGIGIWLLERQLGAVCVAPIVVVLGRFGLMSNGQASYLMYGVKYALPRRCIWLVSCLQDRRPGSRLSRDE